VLQTRDPQLPQIVDRLGRRLFAGFVVGTFVAAGTWLLGAGKHEILAIVLLVFGVLVMLGHTALDLLGRMRRR
jgi:hypothetical protein